MIEIRDVVKGYDDQIVLDHINISFEENGIYCLMGASGRGKTTLLRLMAGLEKQDTGKLIGLDNAHISMVFQEDRLFLEMNALRNLQVVGIEHSRELLIQILPEETLTQPVSEYSGGMRRRVAIARAVGAKSSVLLMDEPFNGLDDRTKDNVIEFILTHRANRLLIVTTHHEEDAEKLGAKVIKL